MKLRYGLLNVSVSFGQLWFDLGWFSGEFPKILGVDMLNFNGSLADGFDSIVFFHIQVLKFVIAFGWSKY